MPAALPAGACTPGAQSGTPAFTTAELQELSAEHLWGHSSHRRLATSHGSARSATTTASEGEMFLHGIAFAGHPVVAGPEQFEEMAGAIRAALLDSMAQLGQ